MVALAPLVLLSASLAHGAPVHESTTGTSAATQVVALATAELSTYDDYASCADRSDDESALAADAVEVAVDTDDCRARPHVAPAVIDCNDSRLASMVGAMIGTCDMPRVRARALVPTLRPWVNNSSSRAPDLFDSDDAHPLRTASRGRAEAEPALPALASYPLARALAQPRPSLDVLLLPNQASRDRLERPPRA